MPYDLTLRGDFFELAEFFRGIDELVGADQTVPSVGGRLITVNSFDLTPAEEGSDLRATVSVTTFVAPPDQGLVGGATEAAPIGAAAVPTEVAVP